MIPLDKQIACLKREIVMRKNAYPKWVESGRMKQEASDREIAAMTAALHTLMKLAAPDPPRGPWAVIFSEDGHLDGFRFDGGAPVFKLFSGPNSTCANVVNALNVMAAIESEENDGSDC